MSGSPGEIGMLDAGLDAIPAQLKRQQAPRIFGALVVMAFGIWMLGPGVAATWLVVTIVLELVVVWVARARDRWTGVKARRLAVILLLAFVHAGWTVMQIGWWRSGEPALQLVCAITIMVFMSNAQAYAYRSKAGYFAAALGPVLGLSYMALTVTAPWPERMCLMACVLTAVVYVSSIALERIEWITIDESERRRAESESRAKSAFVAMLSHEIRTPMNGVLGMAWALKGSKLTGDQSRQVDLLIESGDILMHLLNDALDFSKIEAGRLEISNQPFDLHAATVAVFELWRPAAETKELGFSLVTEPEGPWWVRGDEARLRQVMSNLLSNALKFTAEGGVTLQVKAQAANDGHVQVTIGVSDTGIGMSEAQLARVFRAYVQADSDIGRMFGGTGLGLTITKQLVELMGGKIRVTSKPGEGSEFQVEVTLAVSEPLLRSRPRMDFSDEMVRSPRLLVAEDNRINQAVLRTMLGPVSCELTMVNNGEEAVAAVSSDEFDVILMDIHMPVMDGIEALAAIRSAGIGAGTPVIALTADVADDRVDMLIDQGFFGVIAKPLCPTALFTTIERALNASNPPAEVERCPPLRGDEVTA